MNESLSFSARVLRQPTAVVGLCLIVSLFLFSFVGPFIWRVDPLAINTDQALIAPTGTRQSLVIEQLQVTDQLHLPPLLNLQVIGRPHTQQVLLGVYLSQGSQVTLYRHILAPSNDQDLGLPLAQFSAEQAGNWYYSDQLLLKEQTYFYTAVIARNGQTLRTTLPVRVELASLRGQNSTANSYTQLQAHPFGTDKLGRDMLARVMAGGQISLLIALIAPIIYISFGALYGAISGYFTSTTDSVMMAIADFIIALPFLLFVILLRVVFGFDEGSGIGAIVFALVLLAWPESARVVRAQVLQLRQHAFVEAAKLQGHSSFYIVTRHLLPNTLPSILVVLSFAIPSAIFTEAFLSFLGLGIVPPAASWGSLCNDGVANFLSAPHVLLFPAAFISLAVLAFNLLGDGMRDALEQEVTA